MIHASAIVEPGAELGRDVSVGPFSYIEAGARIGEGCAIGPHVTILRYASLGARCQVHAGAVLGDAPQDLGFKGGDSFVRIGDGCVIREGVTIHRGALAGSATVAGDGCYLMAYSHLAHNVKLDAGVILAPGALLAGHVQVGAQAFISGSCLVHQFVTIGRLVMMGGGSAVSKDVPPFCTVRPLSTNTILGLNVIGMRRAGFTPEQRAAVKAAFKTIYRAGLNVSDAVRQLRGGNPSGPVLELCDFIDASKRGVCRAGAGGHKDEAEE